MVKHERLMFLDRIGKGVRHPKKILPT